MFYGGWGPDFPDPILQQMDELLTPSIPVVSFMNDTQATQILNSLMFETNQTTYIHGIAQLYNITYNYAPSSGCPTMTTTSYYSPTSTEWFTVLTQPHSECIGTILCTTAAAR